jgi:hypothetical protein
VDVNLDGTVYVNLDVLSKFVWFIVMVHFNPRCMDMLLEMSMQKRMLSRKK